MRKIMPPRWLGTIALFAFVCGKSIAETTPQHDHAAMVAKDPGVTTHVHHHHAAGSLMFQYKYMRMFMKNLLDGSKQVTPGKIVDMMGDYRYMMSPESMTMDMHMIMAMYGLTDKLTMMSMFHYLDNKMLMIDRAGERRTMESNGLGDTHVAVMFHALPNLTAHVGLSLPTGNIDETATMEMNGMTMTGNQPYAMQLGSGTYDLLAGANYNMSIKNWLLGAQMNYIHRFETNDNGYRLGNKLSADGWAKWSVNPRTGISLRLNLERWQAINGFDPDITQTMVMNNMTMRTTPTAFPSQYGGTRLNAFFGLSGRTRGGGFGFAMEYGLPLYQTLNGPQMRQDAIVSATLDWMF